MKIWRLTDPVDYRYARASRVGTWSLSSRLCLTCGTANQKRISPLVIEWEPGSDVIGDFTCPGFGSEFAITRRVASALRPLGGVGLGPVEIREIKAPNINSRSKKSKPSVLVPIDGGDLVELLVDSFVEINCELSTITYLRCETCAREENDVLGVDTWETQWTSSTQSLERKLSPRLPNHGLYFQRSTLGNLSMFRAKVAPAWILCTDSAKQLIESSGFTNVEFLEVGETLQ